MADTIFGRKIKDLPVASGITETDDIIVEDTPTEEGVKPSTKRSKMSTLLAWIGSKLIVNSLVATVAGKALDATQGKILDQKIAAILADLEVNTRKIEGGYLDLYVTSIGKLTWLRISGYPKIALKSGQSYDMFKIAVNTPLYSVYRRINISPTLGIVFTLSSTDAQVTITPFGGDISTTTGVNVSEIYVMK